MDWDFTLRVLAVAWDAFWPYGLFALIGLAVFVGICARCFPDPPRRGPQLRCADDIAAMLQRAEERRRWWRQHIAGEWAYAQRRRRA